MKENGKEKLFAKMCDAALKQKFSQLARHYDPQLILNTWARAMQSTGIKIYFGKWEWWRDKTFEQLLDRLDDYFDCLEILIQENGPGYTPKRKQTVKGSSASRSPKRVHSFRGPANHAF